MQKIIDYKIAYSDAISCFEEEVNRLLKEGWVPYGSLAFQHCPNEIRRFNYCQPMVKYEKGFDALGHDLAATAESMKKSIEFDKNTSERLGL